MSAMTPYLFGGAPVRVLRDEAGEPLFVAKDVAIALGYAEASNPARLFQGVPHEWKGVKPIHTPGGNQPMQVITEQGLYFFLGRSDKPKALPFQKWLAGGSAPGDPQDGPLRRAFRTGRGFAAFRGIRFSGFRCPPA